MSNHTQPQNSHHPSQAQYVAQPGYGPQTQHLQTQILPSGHTVYVNAPPHPYGYATVQYHPHAQQHHIVHQTVPAGLHPNEHQQYISVVPISGTQAQVQSVGPGGTYAYWQPDGHTPGAGLGQTLTIVNAHGPGGVPLAVARVGNGGLESPQAQPGTPHAGRGGKEKGAGGRKARGTGVGAQARGRGGESKHQGGHSTSSPLLEDFKTKKIRDWAIYDIKGECEEISSKDFYLHADRSFQVTWWSSVKIRTVLDLFNRGWKWETAARKTL